MHNAFTELGLVAELTRAVADEGYTQPTPVQAQTIPPILDGRDVLAGAQTGTGKTAGFTLPLLQRLAQNRTRPTPRAVRALILTPTRELAAQVEASVRTYGRHLPLRSVMVCGGMSMRPQTQALARGVDILVATPGRLLDHAGERSLDLSRVEILVLDEADRMLDMGFIHDMRRVLALLPKRRQSLLFSATFSADIRKLAESFLNAPTVIEVARRRVEAELITQRVHPVRADRKRDLLVHLVASGDWQQVLVFTRTKHGANRLAEQLCKEGIDATAIHGNKSQPQRTKALSSFKRGDVRVLVATDIAARGLDIEGLPHVVNFDMPLVAEDYVHRIGRTGRAGSAGEAVSLVAPEERGQLEAIERLLGRQLGREPIEGFEAGSAGTQSSRSGRQRETRAGQPSRDGARRADANRRRAPSRPQRPDRDENMRRGGEPGEPRAQRPARPERNHVARPAANPRARQPGRERAVPALFRAPGQRGDGS